MLELLSLLNRRPSVTLGDMLRLCDIPRRTAYRYLNELSQADVPVYYDRDIGAYRLVRHSSVKFESLSKQQLFLLTACTQLMVRHLGDGYASQLRVFFRHAAQNLSASAEELLAALGTTAGVADSIDYASELNLLLCQLAAIEQIPVTIFLSRVDEGVGEARKIERPAILFREGWRVKDLEQPDHGGVELAAISHVVL
jgi:predicted DNA-binding transcriptional regulator YafY